MKRILWSNFPRRKRKDGITEWMEGADNHLNKNKAEGPDKFDKEMLVGLNDWGIEKSKDKINKTYDNCNKLDQN